MFFLGRCRARYASLVTLAALLRPAPALGAETPAAGAASPGRLTLTWDAPAGCSTSAEVSAEVERLLGHQFAPGMPIQVAARVVAAPGRASVVLTLEQEGQHSERTLIGRDCRELASAAALVIALAIDPTRAGANAADSNQACQLPELEACEATQPAPPASCPRSPTPATPSPTHCADAAASPPRPSSSVAPLRVGLALREVFGELPEALPSPELWVGYGDRFRAELGGLLAFAQKAGASGTGAAFTLWALTARGCIGAAELGLFQLCGGAEAGALRGQGYGTDVVHARSSLWLTPLLSVSARVRRGGSEFGAGLSAGFPLVRDEFALAGRELFRPAAFVVGLRAEGVFSVF